jgi:hypothetical protein
MSANQSIRVTSIRIAYPLKGRIRGYGSIRVTDTGRYGSIRDTGQAPTEGPREVKGRLKPRPRRARNNAPSPGPQT